MYTKSVLVDFEELKTLCSSLLGNTGLGDLICSVNMGKKDKWYLFGSRLAIYKVRETTGCCLRPLSRLWLEDFLESTSRAWGKGHKGWEHWFILSVLRGISYIRPSPMCEACYWPLVQPPFYHPPCPPSAHAVGPRLSCLLHCSSNSFFELTNFLTSLLIH